MLGSEKDDLNAALNRASGATKVAVVLFAALIQSWFLLHDEAGVYRRALAEKVSTININDRPRDQPSQRVRVRNQILGRAIDRVAQTDINEFAEVVRRTNDIQKLLSELSVSANPNDEWKAKVLRSAVGAAPREPKAQKQRVYRILGRAIDPVAASDVKMFADQVSRADDIQKLLSELSVSANPNDEWKAKALRSAVDAVHREPNARKQRAERRLRIQQAVVRQVSFEFLGLKFAVNGIWAWSVWLIFFTVGVMYLWLERRACLKVCRVACQPPYVLGATSQKSLPLWVRPLPHPSQWSSAVSSGCRQDATADPLGTICTVLLLICLLLSLDVLRMTALSNSLFRDWPAGYEVGWNAIVNASALVILISVGIQWVNPIISGESSPDLTASATGVTRRWWLFGSLSGLAFGSFQTLPDLNSKARKALFLNQPRFRTQSVSRRQHKRRRKPDGTRLRAGFYQDSAGIVIYVPESGQSKLAHAQNKNQFKPYHGKFDKDALPLVHPKAIVPFARQGVRLLLCGVLHGKDPNEKATLNRLQANQGMFGEAFELVLAALHRSALKRRKEQLPNLQLFDLLAAIALNNENLTPVIRPDRSKTTQLAEVRRLIEEAHADFEKERPPAKSTQESVNNGEKHSRHERRRLKGDSFQARLNRLVKFQRERSTEWSDQAATLKEAQRTHVVRNVFP